MQTSNPRLTEERLRTWLDATQAERERLCAAILPFLGDYHNVQPRRPKGGPDQSRDVEAMMADGTLVWGAVGFRNQVSDSNADKTWVKKKFKADLTSGKAENPDLTGFVFFTNVDLRPGEIRSLKTLAATNGISHCEVFYRERIRQVLDSVQGMPYRLQYLHLQMSMEEQLAFFNAFGTDLRLLLEKQHSTVEERLNGLDFWMASVRPLRQFWIIIPLDQEYSFEELGHFRFRLRIGFSVNQHRFTLTGRDKAIGVQSPDGIVSWPFSTETKVLRRNHPVPTIFAPSSFAPTRPRLVFRASLHLEGDATNLDDLNHLRFEFAATRSLTNHATSIMVVGNRFVLADLKNYCLQDILRSDPIPDWPEPLSEVEQRSPLLMYGIGEFNFDRETPRKYPLTLEDRRYLLS